MTMERLILQMRCRLRNVEGHALRLGVYALNLADQEEGWGELQAEAEEIERLAAELGRVASDAGEAIPFRNRDGSRDGVQKV